MLNVTFSRIGATTAKTSVRLRELDRLCAFSDRVAATAASCPQRSVFDEWEHARKASARRRLLQAEPRRS